MPLAGGRVVAGGNFTGSYIGSQLSASTPAAGPEQGFMSSSSALARFASVSFITAGRFGAGGKNSLGFEFEKLKGTGSLGNLTGSGAAGQAPFEMSKSASDVSQTRISAGLNRKFSDRLQMGLFYRYGWIQANDQENLHTILQKPVDPNSTRSSGHSSEFGLRLRGSITPKLYFGVAAAWLGLSLTDSLERTVAVDSQQRNRMQRGTLAAGIGYLLNPRTVISLDVAGGSSQIRAARTENLTGSVLQYGASRNGAVSFHAAVQRDLPPFVCERFDHDHRTLYNCHSGPVPRSSG